MRQAKRNEIEKVLQIQNLQQSLTNKEITLFSLFSQCTPSKEALIKYKKIKMKVFLFFYFSKIGN